MNRKTVLLFFFRPTEQSDVRVARKQWVRLARWS